MFSKEAIQKEREHALEQKREEQITSRLPPNQLRIHEELKDLDKEWLDNLVFDDPNKLDKFTITITPADGYWKDHPHQFEFIIPSQYPHKVPSIICKTRIWHPNIDNVNGLVDFNLRATFSPLMGLTNLFLGLLFVLLEPNPNDPQNAEAAKMFLREPIMFKQKANNYMKGIY